MKKLWGDNAWNDYLFFQKENKKILRKINKLLEDISRNGYKCSGKPEHLSNELSDYYSVRIDKKNRIVFKIENNCIEILQCGSHYKGN